MNEKQNVLEVWFTQMFTTTDYLFNVSTTWQYMIIIPLILVAFSLILYKILFFIKKDGLYFDKEELQLKVAIFFSFAIYLIWFLGLLYYGLVLIKIMWASA